MRVKAWAAFTIAPSVIVLNMGSAMAEPDLALTHERLLRPARLMALHVEVAGADDTNPATPKQLEDAGTNMVPAEELKKVEPVMQPRVNKVPEEKEPQVIMPAKAEPPEKQPMATEMPLVESKPETPAQMENTLAGPYLRLDAGYAFNRDSDGTQTAGDFTSESIGGTAVWGGGIGYRFNENLRSDVTFSYRPDADVSATTAAGNTASTEVSALSVMLNAYWDVITVDKVTPYLGAGIGMAHLSTSDQATSGGIGTETGATANNFAWSLTAGAAYAVLDNTSLDMNYRFINLGDFGQQGSTSYDALMAHEVRAGLRVIF